MGLDELNVHELDRDEPEEEDHDNTQPADATSHVADWSPCRPSQLQWGTARPPGTIEPLAL